MKRKNTPPVELSIALLVAQNIVIHSQPQKHPRNDDIGTPGMIKTAAGFLRRHSHTNWALADQAMVSGVTFLTGILLARGLGIAEFGRFSLAWLVVLFVQSIQENAIIAPLMIIGPKQEVQQRPAYYGGVFLQQLVLALVSAMLTWACLGFAGAVFGKGAIASLAVPVAAAVLLCQTQEFLRRYFFTGQRPAISFLSDAIRYLGQLTLFFWIFILSKTGIDTNQVLWITAGASAVSALVAFIFVGRLQWARSSLWQTAVMNWRFSRWLVGSAIVQWLGGNLFTVAAGALLGVTAVGALKAAQSLIGVLNILFQGLENVVPVRAAQRYHTGGAADLFRYLAVVTRVGLAATAAVGLIFAVDPTFWLRLIFGQQFVEYGYLLRWFAALYCLTFLAVSVRFALRAMERTMPIFAAYTVGTLFSLAAAYPLVTALGLTGVLVGLFSIQLLMLAVMLVSLRQALVAAEVHRHI